MGAAPGDLKRDIHGLLRCQPFRCWRGVPVVMRSLLVLLAPGAQAEGLSGDIPATVRGQFAEESVCEPYPLFLYTLFSDRGTRQAITRPGLAQKPCCSAGIDERREELARLRFTFDSPPLWGWPNYEPSGPGPLPTSSLLAIV